MMYVVIAGYTYSQLLHRNFELKAIHKVPSNFIKSCMVCAARHQAVACIAGMGLNCR